MRLAANRMVEHAGWVSDSVQRTAAQAEKPPMLQAEKAEDCNLYESRLVPSECRMTLLVCVPLAVALMAPVFLGHRASSSVAGFCDRHTNRGKRRILVGLSSDLQILSTLDMLINLAAQRSRRVACDRQLCQSSVHEPPAHRSTLDQLPCRPHLLPDFWITLGVLCTGLTTTATGQQHIMHV